MRTALVAWLYAHGLPGWLAPDYATMTGVAALVGAIVSMRVAARDRARVELDARALLLAYAAALLGGYVFEWIRAVPDAIAEGSLWPILTTGRAAYGGLIAGLATPAIYLARRRVDPRAFLDRATPAIGVSFLFVRVGCFLEGCDYGQPTAAWIGVRFPPGSLAADAHAALGWIPLGAPSLPVHPTELYESALGVLASVLAWTFALRLPIEASGAGRRARPAAGTAFLIWLGTYAIGRFTIERLRGDADRGVYGLGVSTAQLVSLAILVFVALAAWRWIRASRAVAFAAAACAIFVAAPASAQNEAGLDTIVLRSGERLRGALVEVRPNDRAVMRLPNGQTATVVWSVIDHIETANASRPVLPPGVSLSSTPPPPYGAASPPPAGTPPPATATPATSETKSPAPPDPPASTIPKQHDRLLTFRIAAGGGFVLARPDVPSGPVAEVDALFRVRLAEHLRFEIGLEGRAMWNDVATHQAIGLPLELDVELGRVFELNAAIVPGHTWIHFASPFFTNTNAYHTRFVLGPQLALGGHVLVGATPLAFTTLSSETVGVITTWEPRAWVSLTF